MKNLKTRIGLIKFTNCLPINYALEQDKPDDTEFIYGTPAELNTLMEQGEIDVAPISSFEYIKNKNNYSIVGDACITSDGECGSVLLFSRKDVKALSGSKIALPVDSATSIAMLKIILNKYDISLKSIKFEEHDYAQLPDDMMKKGFDAVLFIGDNALKYNNNSDKTCNAYDIGLLWKQLTGYPAVFGIWVARNDWLKNNEDNLENRSNIINKAIETGLGKYFNEVLGEATLKLGLEKEIIRDYLRSKIKYNCSIRHKESLELFEKFYNQI